jgi:para-nitrobenzyl esterase
MQVATEAGIVEGKLLESGAVVFAGIPFAQPPLGPLRFEAPQPAEPWDGVRLATAFAPDPVQPARDLGLFAAIYSEPPTSSEDCLYLNVWTTPEALASPKPVMVWIFGGGFEGGSASPPLAPGETQARDLDCVIVSLSYRVGALGYLHLPGIDADAAPTATNQGLGDLVLGLQWVKRNVARFGGDPERITVAGVSAGAFSIGSLLSLPETQGLFQQAILASGSDQRIFGAPVAAELAHDFLRAAQVTSVDALRHLSEEELLAAQVKVGQVDIGQRNSPGGKTWGIVHDGTVVATHPHAAVEAGCAKEIRLLISTCRDEANMWAMTQAATFAPADEATLLAEMRRNGRTDPAADLGTYRSTIEGTGRTADLSTLRAAFLTDAIYTAPARLMADAHTESGGTTYLYEFAGAPMGPTLGAFHAVDMFYLLRLLPVFGVSDEQQLALQDELSATWRAFIHHGDPGWAPHQVGQPVQHHLG